MNAESETIEYKKSLSELKEGLISMAAILNKHGRGELWFGIKNNSEPVGLQISEKTLRDVSQSIAAHIEPKIYPMLTQEMVAGKTCLKVAFQGGERPYYAYGRAYMRVSDADRQLSASELERLILEKNRSHRRWDMEVSGLNLSALDLDSIRQFVEKAGLTWKTPEAALENLGLLQDEHLLNAASVFFQKQPPYELRTAVFAGTSSSSLLDQQSFKGGILELIEEAQRYILKNIHIGMHVEGLERVDVPEIDLEAIREAVINAFCHRDYRDPDPVQVAVYQDRVEIRNPGTLIDGMTLEDLQSRTVSRRRNPLIAELLRRIRLVESWGRGIPLILERAPETQFTVKAGLFVSALLRTEIALESSEKSSEKTLEMSEKTVEMSEKTVEMSEKTAEMSEKSAEMSEKIVQAILSDDQVTIAQLAELVGVTTRTIERHMKRLQETGQLRRVGPDKGGYWEVLKS